MTHRYHPDPARGDVVSVLYDACERCSQHARYLTQLDDDHLGMLALMADRKFIKPVTDAEFEAVDRLGEMRLIVRTAERAAKSVRLNPALIERREV